MSDYVDDLDKPQFPTSLVCEAAEIDFDTFKNWALRGRPIIILGGEDRKSEDASRYSFSYRRVLQIALIAKLVKAGLQPTRAAEIAAIFTDGGTIDRPPGRLFLKERGTWLAIDAGAARARVVPGRQVNTIMLESGIWMFVSLDELDAQVRGALGLDRKQNPK